MVSCGSRKESFSRRGLAVVVLSLRKKLGPKTLAIALTLCVGLVAAGVSERYLELRIDVAKKYVTVFVVMTNAVAFNRALADPTRWRIVRLVTKDALCVCELADILEMPQSSVSSHVQVIRKAGLLESEKCEKWTYFRIEAKYLKIILAMEAFFEKSEYPFSDTDAYRTARRLEEREGSCCPGPKKLKPRKQKRNHAIS